MAKLPTENTRTDDDWLDSADDVDQSGVDLIGPEYPYIQWVHGDPKAKRVGGVIYTGGWFFPKQQAGAEEIEGWEAGELTHDNGEETEGFFRRDLTVAVLHWRQCWQVKKANKRMAVFTWDNHAGAKAFAEAEGSHPTSRLHALCIVQGLEEMGPIILTLGGVAAASFTTGYKKHEGVLARAARVIVKPVNAAISKKGKSSKFPYRAFWLTVGANRDERGEPLFSPVGEQQSVLLALPSLVGVPDKLDLDGARALFVGRENLAAFNDLYADAADWSKAWNDIAPQADDDDEEEDAPQAETEGKADASDDGLNPYASGGAKSETLF